MTRGRESNTAHVVTGKTAPPGHEPYQQAAPESVLADVLRRDAETCPPPSRSARPRNGPAEPGTCSTCGPPPPGKPCTRTSTSRSKPGSPSPRPGVTSASTPARPCSSSYGQPSSPGTTSARSSTRSPPRRWTAPGPSPACSTAACSSSPCQTCGHDVTWAQRTPAGRPAGRARAGRRARRPGPGTRRTNGRQPRAMAARHLGVPGARCVPRASGGIRATRGHAAGLPGCSRDHRPRAGCLPTAAPRQPELEAHAARTMKALEIRRSRHLQAMTRGELEARILEGDRAQATAPPR